MRARDQAGFTLIEMTAAIACMAILGAIAMPRLQGYLLQSRLNAAKPYLMEIAAKQRMYRAETGNYCCTAYTAFNEDTLVSSLGVSLSDMGDFCFMFLCQNVASGTTTPASSCENPTSPSYVVPASTNDAAPQFEVWAVLRSTTDTTSVAAPGGTKCQPATSATSVKLPPSGWVQPAATKGPAGRSGQVVVLRYPPPQNGPTTSPGAYHAVKYLWQDGITVSDALFP